MNKTVSVTDLFGLSGTYIFKLLLFAECLNLNPLYKAVDKILYENFKKQNYRSNEIRKIQHYI